MKPATTPQRSIDVSGLPADAIQVVESLVALLRDRPTTGGPTFASPAEWARAIREWAEGHPARHTSAYWGRDAVYAGRGE